jgi:hypothetical protein
MPKSRGSSDILRFIDTAAGECAVNAVLGVSIFVLLMVTVGSFVSLLHGSVAFVTGGIIAGVVGWKRGGAVASASLVALLLYDPYGGWVLYSVVAAIAATGGHFVRYSVRTAQ